VSMRRWRGYRLSHARSIENSKLVVKRIVKASFVLQNPVRLFLNLHTLHHTRRHSHALRP
jgi:hypothetical protein